MIHVGVDHAIKQPQVARRWERRIEQGVVIYRTHTFSYEAKRRVDGVRFDHLSSIKSILKAVYDEKGATYDNVGGYGRVSYVIVC